MENKKTSEYHVKHLKLKTTIETLWFKGQQTHSGQEKKTQSERMTKARKWLNVNTKKKMQNEFKWLIFDINLFETVTN